MRPSGGEGRLRDEVNWKVAIPASLVGALAIFVGLAFGGFDRSAFSSVLIDVGTAIGLVVVLVLLERGVLGHAAAVARREATETVTRETAGLRDRIVRLETLDAAQAEERVRRRQAATEAVQRLLDQELSAATVGDVLVHAHEHGLFADGHFRVRTSADPKCHVLHLLPLKAANGVAALWLDFEPFAWGEMVELDGRQIPTPEHKETTVMWIHDQDAADIASDLEAALERKNLPTYGFSLGYALRQLAKSVNVAERSRAAVAGDPVRLQGSLELLINDQWAITSFGLESVDLPLAYPVSWAGFKGGGGAAVWRKTTVKSLADPPAEALAGWYEAVAWVTEREGWAIGQT